MKVRSLLLTSALAAATVPSPSSAQTGNVPTKPTTDTPALLNPPDNAARPQAVPALISEPSAACSTCDNGCRQPAPFTPFMLGDFVGPVANLFSQFKIAEGESPRPVDRAFFKYNFYNNVDKSRWSDPTEPIHNVNLHLYTIGTEQTFLDGKASVGLRVPFDTINGEAKGFHIGPNPATGAVGLVPGGPGLDVSEIANLIVIAKMVAWEDRPSGSLLSGGVVASIPTASSQKLDPGLSTLMYVQPFSGFILTSGDLFVQGFTSMTLPVARPESIVSFNDVGVGYYVYRDATGSRMISAVAPTFEVHYTAPIRQPNPRANLFDNFFDNIRIHDTVDLTFGSTIEFGRRATLGTGIALPVTGPKPFDAEILVQLNLLF